MRTFGRTGGRGLSARQQSLIDTRLPELAVPTAADGALSGRDLFGDDRDVWLEIGFGGGEHLVGQAGRNPDIGYIGCEPFIEGMAKALTGIEADQLQNVRLVMDDVRPVMASLQDQSIARAFILFPDPWPKKRQQKRRLIQPEFLESLHRICRPGARVRFATDVKSYADEALLRFLRHGGFEWHANTADDWRCPPGDHLTTRYESKQLGDCAPVWFDFVRS
ncbi:MAG TPA: tRNA (guanosine(46)-N7)-methyltransferase TrmB [Hyphomonas atlantica]|uniref:tRNA (guanine-N(7)-)-methyltransferase n=1 Tax=Hyphomonas atlantica TaxID=1280948 RepID=A0A356W3D3_9PROT|nr:tRNA (guanosine(46)-N7)-methyltransferase TrmB [Hyphomonas atlantica]